MAISASGQPGRSTSRDLRGVSVMSLAVCMVMLSGIAWAGTVYVPIPTGDPMTDWSNVRAAIDAADDGDTVQFGAGTYMFGVDSEFIVVGTPGLRLVGSPDGTSIVGGEVLPVPDTEPCSWAHLYGNCSLLQSPPRGFYLTADEQQISRIRFEGFRTAVMFGFGEFAGTGGYVVENCEFQSVMHGIVAHVESDEESAIRGNKFINNSLPYTVSGGRFRASHNYVASPDPELIPISYTHHAGTLFAGLPFWEEGQALITEHNVFEHNIVGGGVSDGIQVISDPSGIVRNNLFRNNEFYDMEFYGTAVIMTSMGGDIIDNAIVDNTLDGSHVWGLVIGNWSYIFYGTLIDASLDGNVVVGNKFHSIANYPGFAFKSGILLEYTTNTILLDNVITGVPGQELWFGVASGGGHSNKILLNSMDNAHNAAMFYYSPNGVYGSDNAADVALDENFNPVQALDPSQDFSRLRGCGAHLKDTESVADFRECVNEALEELH